MQSLISRSCIVHRVHHAMSTVLLRRTSMTAAESVSSDASAVPKAARKSEGQNNTSLTSSDNLESGQSPVRRRKYGDIMVVVISGFIASAALQKRYNTDEEIEKIHSQITQLDYQRQTAEEQLSKVHAELTGHVEDGVKALQNGERKGFNDWVKSICDKTIGHSNYDKTKTNVGSNQNISSKETGDQQMKAQPKMI